MKGVILRHVYISVIQKEVFTREPGDPEGSLWEGVKGGRSGGREETLRTRQLENGFYCCREPRGRSSCETFGKTTVQCWR